MRTSAGRLDCSNGAMSAPLRRAHASVLRRFAVLGVTLGFVACSYWQCIAIGWKAQSGAAAAAANSHGTLLLEWTSGDARPFMKTVSVGAFVYHTSPWSFSGSGTYGRFDLWPPSDPFARHGPWAAPRFPFETRLSVAGFVWQTSWANRVLSTGAPDRSGPVDSQTALIPLWALVLPALLWCVPLLRQVRVRVADPVHCRRCGYDLRASPRRCPECGEITTETNRPS